MKTRILLASLLSLALGQLADTSWADDFTTDFETGYLRGWTKTGTAFDAQPTLDDNPTARGRGQPSNHQGRWWIGTHESFQGRPGQSPGDIQGDGPTGTLTSPPFVITGELFTFLVGGGTHFLDDPNGATVVSLEVDGDPVFYATGNNSETMVRAAWNISPFLGRRGVLKIIDNNSGGWGHINCDDFQMLDAAGNRLSFTAAEAGPAPPPLSVCAAPSGPDWSTISQTFVTIGERSQPPLRTPPSSMSTGIATDDHADLRITFSGEVEASGSGRVFVRALVDGQPAAPSDVVFAQGWLSGTRSFTFVQQNVPAGGHGIEIQWKVDAGCTAYIGDTTVSVFSPSGQDPAARLLVRAAPSGAPLSHTGNWWEDLPELSGSLTTPRAGKLAVTFSAEAYGDAGARTFVRALVDGQIAEPGPVLLAGYFRGVSSHIFTLPSLPAGEHLIQLQWMTDAGQTVHLGDRTVAVVAAPELTKYGGLAVNSPPPGADIVTTSGTWEDVPAMTSYIATAADSHLEIAFTAEATIYGAQGIYLRALVDGEPANPSDVFFNSVDEGAFATRAFTFIRRGLSAGPHQVRLQWHTQAGGGPALGDRTMTLNYWRAAVPDMSTAWSGLKPVVGSRKLLAILWDPHRPDHPAPAKSAIENLLFGGGPSVADYFRENSGGRMQLDNAGVLGWYDAAWPATYYWGPNDPGDANGDGWIEPHVQKWAEAIRDADVEFDFAACDTDRDGVLTPDELAIVIVIPQNNSDGYARDAVGRQVPLQDLIVDGVKVSPIAEAYIGAPPDLGLVAHELAHLLLRAGDMYFYFFQPYAAGPYSLMDQSPAHPGHLDPVHKLHLGWLTPQLVMSNRWCQLRDIESSQEVLLLYDPVHGPNEYFVVENRWRGTSYDSGLPCSGLAVWQVIEDPVVYNALAVPPNVDPTQWNSPLWQGWSRRGIRMIRPVYGPPYNTALWDGSNSTTGYDLLSTDPESSHVTLAWADGTPSGFSLLCLPRPAPQVRVAVLHSSFPDPLAGPPLKIRRTPRELRISWPAEYGCFNLEQANELPPRIWVHVSPEPQTIGDENVVTVALPRGRTFYRLHKP